MYERGSIKYLDRYKQLISYEGMERHRKITPTDIDGLIDYNGKAFIYIECKFENKQLDYGQKLALENLINSHEKAGHKSCAIIIRHSNKPEEIIIAKEKIISSVYFEFKWHNDNRTLIKFIEDFENYLIENSIEL